jgi:hypothetical protein
LDEERELQELIRRQEEEQRKLQVKREREQEVERAKLESQRAEVERNQAEPDDAAVNGERKHKRTREESTQPPSGLAEVGGGDVAHTTAPSEENKVDAHESEAADEGLIRAQRIVANFAQATKRRRLAYQLELAHPSPFC